MLEQRLLNILALKQKELETMMQAPYLPSREAWKARYFKLNEEIAQTKLSLLNLRILGERPRQTS